MYQKDVICVFVMVIGLVLFLYGSNSYNAILGWGGVLVVIAGLAAEISLEAYRALRKKEVG